MTGPEPTLRSTASQALERGQASNPQRLLWHCTHAHSQVTSGTPVITGNFLQGTFYEERLIPS